MVLVSTHAVEVCSVISKDECVSDLTHYSSDWFSGFVFHCCRDHTNRWCQSQVSERRWRPTVMAECVSVCKHRKMGRRWNCRVFVTVSSSIDSLRLQQQFEHAGSWLMELLRVLISLSNARLTELWEEAARKHQVLTFSVDLAQGLMRA